MGPEWTAPPGYVPIAPAMMQPANVYANPTFVPGGDSQSFWETLVDVVSNYFPIDKEEPLRMIGDLPTEGKLTTVAQVSPTIFEPWRHDSGNREERVENTLQTMRRYAVLRVVPAPTQGGYWVEVTVHKELEANARPDHAMAGAATLRYDSTLVGVINPVIGDDTTVGWIDKGRDTALEQAIIDHLMCRCGQTGFPTTGRMPAR
jgi:hypothetical protein